MYQGPVDSLVPYLQTMNLDCPNHHSPTDFGNQFFCNGELSRKNSKMIHSTLSLIAIDVASGEYGDVLPRLVSGIENGRRIFHENSPAILASPALSHGNIQI